MKKFLIALPLVLLAACQPQANQLSFPVLPDELKDCKFYSLRNGDGTYLVVTRCPNSSTSTDYAVGKTRAHTVVIDGVTYTRNQEESITK